MTAPSPAAAGLPDEDVERVARAIWEGLPDSGYGRKPWPDLSRSTHYLYRTMAAAALAEMRPTAAEGAVVGRVEAARWIAEAVSALQAATVISERMHRTGQVEGLNLGNHDRLVQSADRIRAALAPVPHDADGGERR